MQVALLSWAVFLPTRSNLPAARLSLFCVESKASSVSSSMRLCSCSSVEMFMERSRWREMASESWSSVSSWSAGTNKPDEVKIIYSCRNL